MDDWTQILLVMALLNFTLNIASVHLGWWKRKNLVDKMEHIIAHICPITVRLIANLLNEIPLRINDTQMIHILSIPLIPLLTTLYSIIWLIYVGFSMGVEI